MVKQICMFSFVMLSALTVSSSAFSSDDGDVLQEYPGGDVGFGIGDGYEVMPDGELLPPSGYRDEYRDTDYGLMAGGSFAMFPGVSLKKQETKTEKKPDEVKDYIFQVGTQTGQQEERKEQGKRDTGRKKGTRNKEKGTQEDTESSSISLLWGVSGPVKNDNSSQK